MKIIRIIPNTITSLNLLSGSLAIVFAIEGQLVLAGILIFLSAVFDFLDGFSARLLNAYSAIGKELDSLADVISFGLAPSVIAFALMRNILAPQSLLIDLDTADFIWVILPFIMAVFSALRLAKFNIDERQSSSFIGLPTPANAIVWASAPIIIAYSDTSWLVQAFQNPWLIGILSVIMSILLVAELPLFSLKFKNLKWKDNKIKFIFLGLSILLLALFKVAALPLIIIVYILLSILNNALGEN